MRISIIGFGTVGQGVADLVQRNATRYRQRCGASLEIASVLVRSTGRTREIALPPSCVLTDDPDAFFAAKPDILVEVAGGIKPANTYLTRALTSGADVVTANKALIAKHGSELFATARANNRALCMEAAVAGGVPAIDLITDCLGANDITTVAGILNGTCNYILTMLEVASMCDRPKSFVDILTDAQQLGYAEADPTLDVSGRDSAEKLAILCAVAFGMPIDPDDIPNEGVENITPELMERAREKGSTIKLLGIAHRDDNKLYVSNRPTLVGRSPLSSVKQADMALSVAGDAMNSCTIEGSGAGRYPTASAVVADILRVARARANNVSPSLNKWPTSPGNLEVIDLLKNPSRTKVPGFGDFPVFSNQLV